MAALILYVNGAPGIKYELDKTRVTIGRELDNDICLDDACVSKHHAVIEIKSVSLLDETYEYRLIDLGSTNACQVNNERTSLALLTNGDTVRIGNQWFKFDADTDPRPAQAAPAAVPSEAETLRGAAAKLPTEVQMANVSAARDFDTKFSRRLRTF